MLLSVMVVTGDRRCHYVGVDLTAYLVELMRCIEALIPVAMHRDIEAADQLVPRLVILHHLAESY